jgi:hypothetical protein
VSRFAFSSDYDSPNGRPWTAARVLALGQWPGADFHIGPDVVIRMPVSLVHPGGFAFGVRQGGVGKECYGTAHRTLRGVPSRAYWYLPTFSLASSMRRCRDGLDLSGRSDLPYVTSVTLSFQSNINLGLKFFLKKGGRHDNVSSNNAAGIQKSSKKREKKYTYLPTYLTTNHCGYN